VRVPVCVSMRVYVCVCARDASDIIDIDTTTQQPQERKRLRYRVSVIFSVGGCTHYIKCRAYMIQF